MLFVIRRLNRVEMCLHSVFLIPKTVPLPVFGIKPFLGQLHACIMRCLGFRLETLLFFLTCNMYFE